MKDYDWDDEEKRDIGLTYREILVKALKDNCDSISIATLRDMSVVLIASGHHLYSTEEYDALGDAYRWTKQSGKRQHEIKTILKNMLLFHFLGGTND